MIRLRMDFFSETLKMGTSAVILLPQIATHQIGMASTQNSVTPVLYLLHGLSDDCTTWERRTSIERYAASYGIAVVMPEVRRSFYTNERYGENYFDFIAKELPELIHDKFNLGHTPENTRENSLVAGLSMGGFGAIKLALNLPQSFKAAGSFSGALNLKRFDFCTERREMAARLWGLGIVEQASLAPEDDLIALLANFSDDEIKNLPKLWVGCGKQDFLLDQNLDFLELATARKVAITTELTAGDHTWELWDEYLQRFLNWALKPK